jgi:hypothetical protein
METRHSTLTFIIDIRTARMMVVEETTVAESKAIVALWSATRIRSGTGLSRALCRNQAEVIETSEVMNSMISTLMKELFSTCCIMSCAL